MRRQNAFVVLIMSLSLRIRHVKVHRSFAPVKVQRALLMVPPVYAVLLALYKSVITVI